MPKPAALNPRELSAYFALMEVSSLLQHAVEQQLRSVGGLSYVQFQLLARLNDSAAGEQRMTDLADGVVYSRSGLTYQADQLEKAGLIRRSPSVDDERSTTVTITRNGQRLLAKLFPGHIAVVRQLLFAPLAPEDVETLTEVLGRVRDEMRAAPPRSASPRRRSVPVSDT